MHGFVLVGLAALGPALEEVGEEVVFFLHLMMCTCFFSSIDFKVMMFKCTCTGWLGRRRSSGSSSWASRSSSSTYPRQSYSGFGSSSSVSRQNLGGRVGSAGSYGSRGLGGGGFVAPKPISRGTYSAPGGKTFGSATPGHGTNWGTSFPSGVGK